MNLNLSRIALFSALLFSLALGSAASAAELDDRHALAGVKTGKAVFDIASGNAKAIVTILGIVDETIDGLQQQGVEPHIVVAFRGPAVRFLSSDSAVIPSEHAATAMALADRVELLAARMMNIDPAKLIKGAHPVANTFNSLIGYQTKGYALIPVF